MKERIEVMISSEAISKRLEEIAEQVQADFAGEQVELVCVLKGGVVTLVELAKKLKLPVTLNFMDVPAMVTKQKAVVISKYCVIWMKILREKMCCWWKILLTVAER